MIKNIPTACTLECDNCNRAFNVETRNVFKSQSQALLWAKQRGWAVNYQNGFALCPECKILAQLNIPKKKV